MRWGRKGLAVLCLSAGVFSADLTVVAARIGDPPHRGVVAESAERAISAPVVPTTVAPTPATTAPAPTPTTPPAPAPTVPPIPKAPTTTRPGAWTLGPYQGLGVWLDVYDWTNELTGGRPKVQLADVDRMADLGIQTLYIQTAHRRSASDVIEPERLLPMVERAHARGMAVVAWYLPTLEDTSVDLRRLMAAAALPVDGLAVDIEALDIKDPAERTHRLLELSAGLRRVMGTRAIGAITQSAVLMQFVNPGFWPGFPWPELGATYDVMLPMSYWSVRKPEWRSGEKYTGGDIELIRAATGRPDMPIHVVGGIADGVSLDDLAGMVRAVLGHKVLGGSLYDWNTSQPAQWDLLRALRVG